MRPSDLVQRVEACLRERRLFRSGQSILVAVSGGLDSMVLLHLLAQLAPKHRWRLAVAHFNHQLRGRASGVDERWVKRRAQKLGLRFAAGRADVRAFAKRHRLSVEMAARQLRHGFLARTARRRRISVIALAHHRDDQLELFFLRLLRGSGGEGLAGMKWRTPSPSDPSVELVRPLLATPRSALRHYAEGQGIAWREDASNAEVDFPRNRIRHRLLPWLERNFGASLEKTIPRLMEIVGAESEFVADAARAWLAGRRAADPASGGSGPAGSRFDSKGRRPFARLPVAVQRRCLQLQLLRLRVAPEFDLIEGLRLGPDRAVCVAPGMLVRRNPDGEIAPCRATPKQAEGRRFTGGRALLELAAARGSAVFAGAELAWNVLPGPGSGAVKPRKGCEVFDAQKVGRRVLLRHWQAGDRFQPIGMSAAVKLQDLFTNRKIPRAQRHQLIVAEAASGELFWVEGLRLAEHFKLDKQTRHRLKWTWMRPSRPAFDGREARC